MNSLTGTFINPFTDFGFKRLFGSEPQKDLLIDFLNTLLPERHQVATLSYRKNEHLGNSSYDRKAVFDLYCESSSGERFIVEIQKAKQKFFKDRSVFYATFPIQEQAIVGDWDFQLAAVYTIGILDFCFDEDEGNDAYKYIHTVKLKELETHAVFYDKLTFIYIELPKFTKKLDELNTHADKWLYAFKHLNSLTDRPEKLQERIFKRFFEAAAVARFSPEERQAYQESLKTYRDFMNVTNTAQEEGRKLGVEEGRKLGVEEGRKLGVEEGVKRGVEEGKHAAAIAIARGLFAKGVASHVVAEVTGLTSEEMAALIGE